MIREIRQEDIERIEEIWLEDSVRLHDFVPDPAEFWLSRLPQLRKEVTETGKTYVCETSGVVNGFITISSSRPYISSLYVDIHLRGQGIGSALLDKAKELHNKLCLHVYQKDVPAVCFYLRQGFFIRDCSHREEGTREYKYRMEWTRQ